MNQITIGDFELTIVSGGTMWSDGGTMFGVIPKALWARKCEPDENNLILMETNCLLVRTPDSLGLIDTGYGDKLPEKIRKRGRLEEGAPLVQNLQKVGVIPQDIDWLILTHLHFDHAGGVTTLNNEGVLQPVFSRARHYVQRMEWEDAVSDRMELAGAYTAADFVPVEEAGLLTLVDDTQELVPGITVERTDGHTRGHQLVRLTSGGQTVVYVGDVSPMAPHVRAFWTMSYDQYPLITRRTKPDILGAIADRGEIAIFPHEPHDKIVRLQRDDRVEFAAAPIDDMTHVRSRRTSR